MDGGLYKPSLRPQEAGGGEAISIEEFEPKDGRVEVLLMTHFLPERGYSLIGGTDV